MKGARPGGPSSLDAITIAVAADHTYQRQLAVVVSGISRCSAGRPHRVFVLHDGYEAELVARVEQAAGEHVQLDWLDARSAALERAILPPRLPMSTLYRLQLPELLPPEVERVIYLDADTVVRAPLDELWNVDLGASLLGAVRDPVLGWVGAPNTVDWRRFGLPPDLPYFNAGVLVVPLAAWREQQLGEHLVELVTTHRFRDADQGALNVAVEGRWLRLAPTWNVQGGHLAADRSHASVVETTDALDDAVQHPSIVHFNWGFWRRPWDDRTANSQFPPHELSGLWYEELDRTAWTGWRPDLRRPSRTAVMRRRLGAARRALVGDTR